jgi:hypothetical protein
MVVEIAGCRMTFFGVLPLHATIMASKTAIMTTREGLREYTSDLRGGPDWYPKNITTNGRPQLW